MSTELSALVVALAVVALPALYMLVALLVLRVLVLLAPELPDAAAGQEPVRPRRDLPRAA